LSSPSPTTELEKIALKPSVKGVENHNYTFKEGLDWPLSFEDAQVFASLPVASSNNNKNYTKTLPNSSRRRKEAEQNEEASGAMKFVLR